MAAVDFFLKMENVPGESQDDKHQGEIDVFSFSWGVSNSGNAAIGGGQGVGKSVAQDFHFVCATQKSSPLLFQSCGNGDHVPKATFIARKAGKGQQEYLTITLSDVLISSYQIGGSNAGEIMPTDQISVNCAKVEMEYKEQKKDGSLGGSTKKFYDFRANKWG